MIKSKPDTPMKHSATSIIAIAALTMVASCFNLAAFDITVTEDPILSGTDSQPEARFKSVAQISGKNIDLIGRVISVNSISKNTFVRNGNDFGFSMLDGLFGENRKATVQWSFYWSGTNFPATVPEMALTIDDIAGYSYRWEEVSTSDAFGFIQDQPSNVNVLTNGDTISAAGMAEQLLGDPASAVTFYYIDKNTITIDYSAQFGFLCLATSVFNHDGNNEFKYIKPLTPPVAPTGIYYTYHFTNPGTAGVPVDFINTLPGNLIWDETFVPVFEEESAANDLPSWLQRLIELIAYYKNKKSGGVSVDDNGNLVVKTEFSEDGKCVEIKQMDLPPGKYNLTLRSISRSNGKFVNAATINPKIAGMNQLSASATIDLP